MFIVGDNSSVLCCFWNLPLTPGRRYQLTLVAVNRQDKEYAYSIAKLRHPVRTSSEASLEEEGSSGAAWAALLLLLIIPALVYFICRSVVCITFVAPHSVMWQRTHLVACSNYEFFYDHSQDGTDTCPALLAEWLESLTLWAPNPLV
jgi:hypothetical protein